MDPDTPDTSPGDESGTMSATERFNRRFELVEALLLALAAVMTSWTAFESTKWSGVQAIDFSRASASRIESARADTRAGQLNAIDVDTFISWISAIAAEERAGQETGLEPDGTYDPAPGTESTFLYDRFRDEFRPAVHNWLETDPFNHPDAHSTPFADDDYRLAEHQHAIELIHRAERFTREARAANQTGDNYVFMTILFALVLFLTGVGSKMDTERARVLLLATAAVVLVVVTIITFTFPIQI